MRTRLFEALAPLAVLFSLLASVGWAARFDGDAPLVLAQGETILVCVGDAAPFYRVDGASLHIYCPPAGETPEPPSTPEPSKTATPEPPATETATLEPAPTATAALDASGIWLSPGEVEALPLEGDAWENVLAWAHDLPDAPALTNRNDHSAQTFARALVCARTGQGPYCLETQALIADVMAAPVALSDVLAACRRLAAYPISADLIDLEATNPTLDGEFRAWLRGVLGINFNGGGGGGTIAGVHERRPNNFGTHCGASRISAALYLDDEAELQRAADVFHGWLGNRAVYAGFTYGAPSWQVDPANPVGINPVGSTIEGHSVDGVLPDDQRRGGPFSWPPPKENYVWEALQGAVAQAWMLEREGFPAFEWEDRALLRAVTWLYEQADYPAVGDDTGTPHLVNAVYGTDFSTERARPGKNGLAFYDWFYGGNE